VVGVIVTVAEPSAPASTVVGSSPMKSFSTKPTTSGSPPPDTVNLPGTPTPPPGTKPLG
jgi:hypothetical protein